ncbi:DUF2911 domain-containing protein [Fulvivirga lutea]|uniref:DUF2911 domain-containing protein n=1 Tax=Fulvivirga lutea TaxID=2810512 RepID=A0A975A0V8_9BACT|nr:DUF2911 domain-containing protein [Fulvivirga lutea]QSE96882.1 DUF2911 domain-containing protein [Fulvivirga lutea]
MKVVFLLALSTVLFCNTLLAQEAVTPRPSPLAIQTMKYEDSYVKVTYSQPHKRDREIFGNLVPYGQVWRTGANEATEITLTGDLIVGSDTLEKGTYSIFTIPNPDKWTIIFNNNLGQWGSYNYTEKADELRVEVPTSILEDVVYEPFTISFDQKNEKAEMNFIWDDVKVSLPIKFITD